MAPTDIEILFGPPGITTIRSGVRDNLPERGATGE
jgi:hypothetical protein